MAKSQNTSNQMLLELSLLDANETLSPQRRQMASFTRDVSIDGETKLNKSDEKPRTVPISRDIQRARQKQKQPQRKHGRENAHSSTDQPDNVSQLSSESLDKTAAYIRENPRNVSISSNPLVLSTRLQKLRASRVYRETKHWERKSDRLKTITRVSILLLLFFIVVSFTPISVWIPSLMPTLGSVFTGVISPILGMFWKSASNRHKECLQTWLRMQENPDL